MPIRPKVPVLELVPEAFAGFMRDVVTAIDQGDVSAWTESDDLLQSGEDWRGYGGLYDAINGRYGFEYLVDDSDENRERGRSVCWYFDLSRQQLRDIASSKVTQMQLWRCEPDCGRRFPKSDYPCDVCDPVEGGDVD